MPPQTPRLTRTHHPTPTTITSLAFSTKLQTIATTALDGILYITKPSATYKLTGHRGAIYASDIVHEENQIVTGGADGTVRVWKNQVKGDVTQFKAHSAAVRSVHLAHTSTKLCTSSDDKNIKIWEVSKARFLQTLSGHTNWVRCARFSDDDKYIVSGGDDRAVKIWDGPKCVHTYHDARGFITSLAVRGNNIATAATDNALRIYDIRTHKMVQFYPGAHQNARCPSVVSSVDLVDEWMLSTGSDGLVKLWDIKEGHLRFTMHAHKGPTTAAVFSDELGWFVSGSTDGDVMVWNSDLEVKSRSPTRLPSPESQTHDTLERGREDIQSRIPVAERSNQRPQVPLNEHGQSIPEPASALPVTNTTQARHHTATTAPAADNTDSEISGLISTLLGRLDQMVSRMDSLERRIDDHNATKVNLSPHR